jgi:hypothetical protein
MHSYADRYTHDFFFERDYPDVKVLDAINARLRPEPQPREFIETQGRVPADVFEKALEKLWTHGGVTIDSADNLGRGMKAWRDSYGIPQKYAVRRAETIVAEAAAYRCR